MSIHKISDLPFADVADSLLSASIIEVSKPVDAASPGEFASNAILTQDFKTFVIKELSAKNEFPNGIYVSEILDSVGKVQINCNPNVDYSKLNGTDVTIVGDPVKIESTKTIEIASPNTKICLNSGSAGIYVDEYDTTGIVRVDQTGVGTAHLTIPTTTNTTFYNAPRITESIDSIREDQAAAATVGLLSAELSAIKAELSAKLDTFGKMAKCDYFVSDTKTSFTPERDTFYFYIEYSGYGS